MHRILISSGIAIAAGILMACQGIPPVSDTASSDTRLLRIASPLEWSSQSGGCRDAGTRARRAALAECSVASLSVVADSCECERAAEAASAWSCSAEAAFTCEDARTIAAVD